MRTALGMGCLLLFASAAAADQLPPEYGVVTPSGSSFTAEITPVGDCDDYVFARIAGGPLTASATTTRGSALVAQVEVIRPDGSPVTEDDGLDLTTKTKSVTAKFVLDATGWWKVRVRGASNTSGAYSVAVAYGKPLKNQTLST